MPTTINGVEFDLSQTNPKANTTGWTRDEREALANEGLVKFKDSVVKKVIKTPLSSNLSVSSYKPSENERHGIPNFGVGPMPFHSKGLYYGSLR